MPSFFVATVETPDGPATAVVRDGRVHRVPDDPGMPAALARWDDWLAELDELAEGDGLGPGEPVEEVAFLPPVPNPPNLYMAGANYADHAREMRGLAPDAEVPRPPEGPFVFLKPTTTLTGAGSPVRLAPGSQKADWEVELAAVIGRRAHRVGVDDALAHVAGYTVANDVSMRDLFKRSEGAELPMTFDWLWQKAWDTSCPMGPWLLPARDCPDPGALSLRLTVNDQVEQDSNTSEMLFSLPEQIAYLSAILPLVPGDVICTGTPAGVGMGKGRFLAAGDTVVAEVEGIGRLENPVVAADG